MKTFYEWLESHDAWNRTISGGGPQGLSRRSSRGEYAPRVSTSPSLKVSPTDQANAIKTQVDADCRVGIEKDLRKGQCGWAYDKAKACDSGNPNPKDPFAWRKALQKLAAEYPFKDKNTCWANAGNCHKQIQQHDPALAKSLEDDFYKRAEENPDCS